MNTASHEESASDDSASTDGDTESSEGSASDQDLEDRYETVHYADDLTIPELKEIGGVAVRNPPANRGIMLDRFLSMYPSLHDLRRAQLRVLCSKHGVNISGPTPQLIRNLRNSFE